MTNDSSVYTTSGMFDYSFSLGYKSESIEGQNNDGEQQQSDIETVKKVEEVVKPSDRLEFKINE